MRAISVAEVFRLKNNVPLSPFILTLELKEACDSNRLYDNGLHQYIAPIPYQVSFSVDSPADLKIVESKMEDDELWGKY